MVCPLRLRLSLPGHRHRRHRGRHDLGVGLTMTVIAWQEITIPLGSELPLAELRADHPRVGVLHMAKRRWVAVWGRVGYLEAASAGELHTLLTNGGTVTSRR